MSTTEKEALQIADFKQHIEEDKQHINQLLIGLEGNLQAKLLTRTRNSVDISFEQMIAHSDEIIKSIVSQETAVGSELTEKDQTEKRENFIKNQITHRILEDINKLLQTYHDMAEKFYTQYKLSLLTEINKQRENKLHSVAVIDFIKSWLDDPKKQEQNLVLLTDDPDEKDLLIDEAKKQELKLALPILETARDSGEAEEIRLKKEFPTLLQKALDKLKDEWQRLNTIAIAGQTLTENTDLIGALETVVDVAGYSVGIEAERIIVVPGDAFALYFFAYLENLAVLTVPIYSVQAMWEWSIFWHELAGYRVRQLEKDSTIDSVRNKLVIFHSHFTANNTEKSKLLDAVTRNNQYKDGFSKSVMEELGGLKNIFSKEYLKNVLKNELDLSDLGGFEHQFERMVDNLLEKGESEMKDKFQVYEEIKAKGWSVDWFKELFEDAWSVLAIREPFLVYFQDILSRHDTPDRRHPPLSVRLSVAKELLKSMDPDNKVLNEPKPEEKEAADQILRFISLLNAAAYQFDEQYDYSTGLRSSFPEIVGNEIGKSIKKWSGALGSGESQKENNQAKYGKVESEKFLNAILSEILFLREFEKNPSANETIIQIKARYEELFAGKDYKQLLELSFYEVDFGFAANAISNIKFGKLIKTAKSFTSIPSTIKLILDGSSKISGKGGDTDITYTGPDGKLYHSTVPSWNVAFKSSSDYQI